MTASDIGHDVGIGRSLQYVRLAGLNVVGKMRLIINFFSASSYKICDIKPMYADMYYEDIQGYDYYGFVDLNVIHGDIRKFYTEDILSFDVIRILPQHAVWALGSI
jgi:hypothetical protein